MSAIHLRKKAEEERRHTNPHSSPGVATFFAFSVVEPFSARVSGDSARPAVPAVGESSFLFVAVVEEDAERFGVSDIVLGMRVRSEGEERRRGRMEVEATIVDSGESVT